VTYSPTLSPTPGGADNAVYNFEDGTTMGWTYLHNGALTDQNTASFFYLGGHSLQVAVNYTSNDIEVGIAYSTAMDLTGKTVIAHVFVPANFPSGSQADIFLKVTTPGYTWEAGPSITLTPGAWNTILFNTTGVPNISSVYQMGIQVIPSAAWSGNIYIDSVDFLNGTPTPTATSVPPTPSFTPTPTTTPTQNLTTTSTPTAAGKTGLTPTWTPNLHPITIFPNPSSGTQPTLIDLGIGNAVLVKIKVFTVAFRMVFEKDYGQVAPGQLITLPTTDNRGTPLANGLYYVQVSTTQGLYTPSKYIAKWLIFR
jgi:hypothetical protein